MSQYVREHYFDMRSAMMLSDQGIERLYTLIYNNRGIKQRILDAEIKRVFYLTDKEYKFFSYVNNCKKEKRW